MYPIQSLTNVHKAKLLHQLFPNEIPEFLEFTKLMAKMTAEQREQLDEGWSNPIFPLATWIAYAEQASRTIVKRQKSLCSSASVFSALLFSDLTACFMNHCILEYISHSDCGEKFKLVVKALYE